MKIQEVRTYEELQGYLREFSNFLGDPTPYDFIGAFHLFLAILDNLAKNHIDADLESAEEFRPWFNEEQFRFLQQLERLR
jgi:hypothetical protein